MLWARRRTGISAAEVMADAHPVTPEVVRDVCAYFDVHEVRPLGEGWGCDPEVSPRPWRRFQRARWGVREGGGSIPPHPTARVRKLHDPSKFPGPQIPLTPLGGPTIAAGSRSKRNEHKSRWAQNGELKPLPDWRNLNPL